MNGHTREHVTSRSPLTLLTRRGLLQASVGTALGALLGPTLERAFAGDGVNSAAKKAKSVILLWLEGGPHQNDSFDPKESTDSQYAFKFKPVTTAAPELRIAACLPELAKQAQDIAVIRSVVGAEKEHSLARYHMQTGWRNTGPIQAPAIGSIVSHELGATTSDGLPSYISIGRAGFPSGYFGPAHKPVVVWDPNQPPENLGLPSGVSPEIFNRRLRLLETVEQGGSEIDLSRHFKSGRDAAVRFMGSKYRAAFELKKENESTRDAYGRSRFGQGCLLARRLVESGVRFVQVSQRGYDTHENHYPRQEELLREFDRGMARLIADLKSRGLLEDTIVVATGEFGRTPKMNKGKGTDHWVDGYSIAMAGGGFRGGCAYGRTSPTGEAVEEDPVSIPDFMATLCHATGIDPDKEYHDDFDRPIKLVDDGVVIESLLA